MKTDETLRYIIKETVLRLSPKRIFLFGSRAKGGALKRADYDIAIDAPNLTQTLWAKFTLELSEHSPTLHHIDLIWLQEASKSLYNEIIKTGILLYEEPHEN